MNLDWIALGIFTVSVVYNTGVLRTVVKLHGNQIQDHEIRISSLEGRPAKASATARV